MSLLRELIYGVDRSPENTDWSDMELFAKALGMTEYYNADFSQRVKKHWLAKWLCTDTWVGSAVFYMDDEPVAISRQSARRSDEEIEFVSKETAEKIRKYIVELTANPDEIKLVDMDAEVGDHYIVQWTRALLTKKGIYNGKEVTLTHPSHQAVELSKTVTVSDNAGNTVEIGIEDFKIPYHVAGEPYVPKAATMNVLFGMAYFRGSDGGMTKTYGIRGLPLDTDTWVLMQKLCKWLNVHHINGEEREEGYQYDCGDVAICDTPAFDAMAAIRTFWDLTGADLDDLTPEEPEEEPEED
jgi:hypothetical protein